MSWMAMALGIFILVFSLLIKGFEGVTITLVGCCVMAVGAVGMGIEEAIKGIRK